MKMRKLDSPNVLESHTFARSKDDPVGATGDFLRPVPTSLPADTEAVIYRPAKSVMTSGRAGLRRWTLEFKPRSPPFIEPLMGWTGGTDPLAQVRLSFPSREAAAAFAGRHGLRFTVCEPHERRQATRSYADNFPAEPADRSCSLPGIARTPSRPILTMPSSIPAGIPLAARGCGAPLLTEREKREVLQRWLWDARLIETAVAEGMPDCGEPSRLDEVLDALARLDAPAAWPQAAADSAPRPGVPPEVNALRRSHSSSPISFRDGVGTPTASQPAVGGLDSLSLSRYAAASPHRGVESRNNYLQRSRNSGSVDEQIGERT